MKGNIKKYLLVLVVPVVFFGVSFFTLSDYGISWDEPIHFVRGQAYLNYFLTGELTYQDEKPSLRRSLYQETSFTAQYFIKNDSGHPPLNGILAASFNLIFYQTLGLLDDIESFHLFNILAGSFLVLVVTIFATQSHGRLAGIVAGLSLAVYPLFFAESHFNIKDPAVAAFFTACVWAFWNSLKNYDTKWLLAAILFFAMGLGTKFNILFLPFILIPWLIVRLVKQPLGLRQTLSSMPRSFTILLIFAPVIVVGLFVAGWPYLWQDPLNNTFNIFRYYKEIGTGGLGQPRYLVFGGFNLFPIIWIAITTPPVILFLTAVGILAAIFRRTEKEKTALLWLIWLIVPVLRVSLPGSSIYGGVRQIMEFLPAMALLSGLGVAAVGQYFKHHVILGVVVLLLFVPHLFVLQKLHPNENIYFNAFIGGINGAKQANIPYWGNSFGNAYYQAVKWLNKNAEKDSKLALVQGTMVNVPKMYLRPDINYSNGYWSSINREGEYLLELTHQGNQIAYPAVWEYIDNVLISVYEVKIDGVAIAKIWKNNAYYSRPGLKTETEAAIKEIRQNGRILEIELSKIYSLARMEITFNSQGACVDFNVGLVKTSKDGQNWREEQDKISDQQVKTYPSLENNNVRYLFPANEAKYITIQTESEKSCLFQNTNVKLGVLNGK